MINGYENEDRYLDYESKILDEITQDEHSMAKAIVDAWIPQERLKVDDELEFRDQLINQLAKNWLTQP